MTANVLDVIIVGGAIAGSTLGEVLARGDLGALVLEKEARFRDRVRGEGTWPRGVAEARRAGLGALLDAVGTVEIRSFKRYENRKPVHTGCEQPAPDDIPGMGFLHPRLNVFFDTSDVIFDTSAEAARLQEGQGWAFQHDPTLGGFSSIEVTGPVGIVADEAARRRYFGDDLG
jgi:choline dehydrogenase-like flavoprotein